MKAKTEKGQAFIRLLFLAYAGLMLWLLFGQRLAGGQLDITLGGSGDSLNFTPFATLNLYWRFLRDGASQSLLQHAVINLVGNVVMFVPLGWFLPRIWQVFRGVFRTVIFAASLICLVELLQYITGLGSCDIDDLILNAAGILIGYGLWHFRHKK